MLQKHRKNVITIHQTMEMATDAFEICKKIDAI